MILPSPSYSAFEPIDDLSSYSPSLMEDFGSVASGSSNTPYTPSTRPIPLPMSAPEVKPDNAAPEVQTEAETRELHLLDQICVLLSRDKPIGVDGVVQKVRAQREAQMRAARLAAELQRVKKKVRAREREVVALRNRIERQAGWAGRIEQEGRDGVLWS